MAAYSLYIERENNDIKLSEWFEYVSNHKNFEWLEEYSTVGANNATIRIPSQGIGLWTSKDSNLNLYFDFSNGKIVFVYSDKSLELAREIAQEFDAIIVGDEGELYN